MWLDLSLNRVRTHDSRRPVSRERMRCRLLQCTENPVAHPLSLSPQLPVPKTQFLYAETLQKPSPLRITCVWPRKTMLKTVQFDRQPRFLTVEIDKEFSRGMLAAELVLAEAPIA